MGIRLSVNIPGKKSQRNTEKASSFHFAAREIISRMENSTLNSQRKSTSTCIMVVRGVLGAKVYLLLQDISLMSIWEAEMGPEVWKARGTSSVHSLPGITKGNSLFDCFLNTNYKFKGFSKWVPSLGHIWESWFSNNTLGNGENSVNAFLFSFFPSLFFFFPSLKLLQFLRTATVKGIKHSPFQGQACLPSTPVQQAGDGVYRHLADTSCMINT